MKKKKKISSFRLTYLQEHPTCTHTTQASLHGAALVHAITGDLKQASAVLAELRSLVENDWARRRGRRGRTAAATEGTSQPSLVVMEALEAYIAAARVRTRRAIGGITLCSHSSQWPESLSLLK